MPETRISSKRISLHLEIEGKPVVSKSMNECERMYKAIYWSMNENESLHWAAMEYESKLIFSKGQDKLFSILTALPPPTISLFMHIFVFFYPIGEHSQLIPNDLNNPLTNIYKKNTHKKKQEKTFIPISGASMKS